MVLEATENLTLALCRNPGLHPQILMMGGSDRGSYFIPKKIKTSEFVRLKKSLLFLAYPKYPSVFGFFIVTQKTPGIFYRPKKITFCQTFRPKKINRSPPPPSLKYVSGAPGCKCQKWKELVKVSKRRKFGDLKLKTVALVKFLKTENLTGKSIGILHWEGV